MYYGLFQKNPTKENMKFPGVLKITWKFRGSSEKESNFHLIKKNHVAFPWVLVFGHGIPNSCSAILLNFLRSFIFSRISKDKVTNPKTPGILSEFYFGIAQ